MRKLTMLGTGNAMVTKCYNTCFFIELDDGSLFLTDAGGGNYILHQFEAVGFDYQRCHHMFVTHGHTDHILGVIWVLRKIADLMNKGKYEGEFHVYCHDVVKDMLLTVTRMMLKKKDFARIGNGIFIHELTDGAIVTFHDVTLTAFDILSTKAKQFGYELKFADGERLTCSRRLSASTATATNSSRTRRTTAQSKKPPNWPSSWGSKISCSTTRRTRASKPASMTIVRRQGNISTATSLCRMIWTC